ncbi:MAG TPA: CsbD family protein [Longimicrobium sp.]|jgi:uncharacterized protein YjbJ (UPF0337 family)
MADRNLEDRGLENSLEGQGKDLKGRVKDAVGGLTGDGSLQAEGKMDRLEGKVQDKLGDLQRDLGRDRDL